MTRIRKQGISSIKRRKLINEDQDPRKRIDNTDNIDGNIVNLEHKSTNANFLDRYLNETSIKLLLFFSSCSLVRDVTINLEYSLSGLGSL